MYSCASRKKNLYNCALTSNGQNSFQSFLRGCSWVIILNLAQIKFSISFLDWLINQSRVCDWSIRWRVLDTAGRISETPTRAHQAWVHWATGFLVFLRCSGEFWYPDRIIWVMILKILFQLLYSRLGVLRGTGIFPSQGTRGIWARSPGKNRWLGFC